MSNNIKPINRDTIHRICSGQVVLSLAIAVKELVENAIDASATNIEVRLKEYGSEIVEVSDNGLGVTKENFQALTKKHCTSKLQEFSDLESVGTLGFRGEALSSLCALSDLTIITKHKSSEYATKIVYDHNGIIMSESPAAREEGTTVSLSNLFLSLPVRRKEFMKNIKREFSKMCNLLYAYCLVSKSIKISCTNQTNKNNKTTVVATEGSNTVRENIICVFGPKQISSLIDVELTEPDILMLQEYGIKLVPVERSPFTIECVISSVTHGSGRSTTDRQFYYINSRPCEPTKIMKLVNEIYKHFNSNQYPFVYLNIKTETSHIDVNVTPDKRQIFIENEKLLMATIKASLLEAFKVFPSTYKLQNVNIKTKTDEESNKSEITNYESRGLKRGSDECTETPGKSRFGNFVKFSKTNNEERKQTKNDLYTSSISQIKSTNKSVSTEINGTKKVSCKLQKQTETEKVAIVKKLDLKDGFEFDLEEIETDDIKDNSYSTDVEHESSNVIISLDNVSFKSNTTIKQVIASDFTLSNIKNALQNQKNKVQSEVVVRFRSEISPELNKMAEKELQKQVTKDMFREMEVLGQFNLGFIITKLDSDLFIIDQHASDEKYNFEQLQLNTTLHQQILVNPKPLELTAANESILIENEEIFKKNGFTFKIDENADCSKKILLTSIPLSKNYAFGKDDIEELLFMLKDSSHTMCRPSRVHSMLASRACRKSVMVGRSLTQSDMRRIVNHMGEIDQPWNCPHGRPTMRHLINLDLIHKQ